MNICRNLESVERWFDGELNDTGDFEAHLAGCSECMERLEELKLLRSATAPEQQMPEIRIDESAHSFGNRRSGRRGPGGPRLLC